MEVGIHFKEMGHEFHGREFVAYWDVRSENHLKESCALRR